MDFISTLWLPILLSAVFVFIVSSVIHMVLGYHASDYQQLPDEEGAMDVLRGLKIPPGFYMVPKPSGMKDYNTPEYKAKMQKGPLMFMMVRKYQEGMAKNLIQWFLYSLVISFFTAYIASHTVGAEADYMVVFRVVGTTAFMGYSLGLFQDAIWNSKPWNATWKGAFDGLIFALVTAGTFGWLWA